MAQDQKSKFIVSEVVEKTTARGSQIISYELSAEAIEMLTVRVKPPRAK